MADNRAIEVDVIVDVHNALLGDLFFHLGFVFSLFKIERQNLSRLEAFGLLLHFHDECQGYWEEELLRLLRHLESLVARRDELIR